jgi:heme-degrading monooxygenase HmoA
MAVKVLIKRRFKPEAMKDIAQALIKARYGALGRQGYISSETMRRFDDPSIVLVISMWESVEDWYRWRDSDERKTNEAQITEILSTPTEYEIYALGLHQVR